MKRPFIIPIHGSAVLVVIALAATLLLGGCSGGDGGETGNDPVCSAGDVKSCPCAGVGDVLGTQTCASDGSSWGMCEGCDIPCTPACADRECGVDPVCGESCGPECPDGEFCENGQCEEEPCIPDCSRVECGDGGCPDQPNACDMCSESESCQNGQCVCMPDCIWQNPPSYEEMQWQEAVYYCEDLELDGYSDWRLPTISELRSLIRGCADTESVGSCEVSDSCLSSYCMDFDCLGCGTLDGPGADGCYWNASMEGVCDSYWSSSLTLGQSGYAWEVLFHMAKLLYWPQTSRVYVRCVR